MAAELAVAHLGSLGHRRIGLAVGPERFIPAQRKAEGFRRAMLGPDRGRARDSHSLYSVEGGQAAAGQLIDQGMTGDRVRLAT